MASRHWLRLIVHSAIDHLASCTHWPVAKLGDHAAVGGDGVLPRLVGLVDLADHRQGLAGLRMPREAVDERLQHVQGLDPALLLFQFAADLEDRVLHPWSLPPRMKFSSW